MNDDELNFELPERQQQATARVGKGTWLMLLFLLILTALNLVVNLLPRNPATVAVAGAEETGIERQLALKLEKQDLKQAAIAAWSRHLQQAQLDAEDKAKISYRIARLHQELGDYDRAIEFYYRSENIAELPELTSEINRRIQHCFENMGKVTALQQELKSRTAVAGFEDRRDAEIVAQIGPAKISSAQLDHLIERQLDLQLEQFAAHLRPEQRRQQKEAMLRQFSSDEQRFQFLSQYISGIMLARKARQEQLHQEPALRQLLQQQADQMLAQRYMQKVLDEKINLSDGDLRMFYQAFKQRYLTAERAKIAHILLENREKAEAAMRTLQQGEEFSRMAATLSLDESTATDGGVVDAWIAHGQTTFPGHGQAAELSAIVFATESAAIAANPVQSEAGFHVIKVLAREAPKQQPFEDVQDQVYEDFRARKEQEIQKKLFDELRNEFDIVIHTSKFALKTNDEMENSQVTP